MPNLNHSKDKEHGASHRSQEDVGQVGLNNHCIKRRRKPVYHEQHRNSRVAQGTYLEVEYIRNVLSVSGTLKYADSGTA